MFHENLFVQPEVLVKCLQELENAASGDAAVREKIASLPAEVSDIKKLDDLRGSKPSIHFTHYYHAIVRILAMLKQHQ